MSAYERPRSTKRTLGSCSLTVAFVVAYVCTVHMHACTHARTRVRLRRLFKIRDSNMPTWHSVISDCNRYSLGFKVPDSVAKQTLMPRATKTYGVNPTSGEVEVLAREPATP